VSNHRFWVFEAGHCPLEGFSKLVSNFKEASLNFEFMDFSLTSKQKILKTIRACTEESTYLLL
jgi:hypothetical protein